MCNGNTTEHASGPKRGIIRRSKNDELDKALHLWFLQKQAMGTPVSGLILTAKTKILYKKLYGSGDSSVTATSDTSENSEGTCFKASFGWLAKFKARHGIRKLMLFQKLQNDAAKKRFANLKQLSMNDLVL